MSYELEFLEVALAEWHRLDGSVKAQFKKKLAERLVEPRMPSAKLSGHPDRYKIKLRTIGYRLVYEVQDGRLVVLVVAIGKRDKNAVYKAAEGR
ncbi:MAG: type II toxin-antitoxin system RelE/ParE family toxin [Dechloromonas sp.]|nr:type II toxin-antitoxin system RelE/ParE family toxin [Dechloromonas sp.]